ncbi:cytochrome P450 3A21-like isoform X9 [Dreissena polymorpha]|uniref:cytochrome P450 3A21-like isoform X9 n=1 Tax=Dreissena polymorpha TaxID=45954 RepID=UPI00226505A6|nr:cytochrome P450 3A21-like isoform X9 [Dreissena polymorpha]
MAVDILGILTLPNWLCGVMATLLAVCLYTWYKQRLFHRLGIPTKKTVFLLGDFVDMVRWGFSYLGMDLYKRYGKVFGIYVGNVPALVISDPDIIKHIMVKDFDHFTDRPPFLKLTKFWKSAVSVAGGDEWRNIRHTISPTFTSGKMRSMTQFLQRSLDVFHDILEKQIKASPNGFDIDPTVRCYTMDVICSTGFGLDVSAQTNPDNPFIKYSKRFLETSPLGMPKFILYILFPDLADMFPRLFETSFMSKDIMDFFMTTTRSLFEDRKHSESKHKDLLQLMVNASNLAETEKVSNSQRKAGLTDEEILINSIIFMLAGYDTTAAGISWVLYELALNPEIQEKLVNAINDEIGESPLSYDNVFSLKYMDMVLSETLRIHSPATRLTRMPDRDTEISGIKIPKGMNCQFVTDILHFLDEYWEDPYTFNPERFAPENKDKINEYAYLPFGVGPRNCVGMRLAQLEVKMTVISMLRKYRIYKGSELKVPLPRSPYGLARPGAPVHLRFEPRGRNK